MQQETTPRQSITPRQWVTLCILALLTLGSSAILWSGYHGLLVLSFAQLASLRILPTVIVTILAYCALLSSVALVGVLARPVYIGLMLLLLASIMPLFWFATIPIVFIGVLVLFITFYQYFWRVRREMHLRTKFSVTKSIHDGKAGSIALTLLVLSLLFYGTTSTGRTRTVSSAETITDFTGTLVNQFLAVKVPDYNPKETLDDFLYHTLAEQLTAKPAAAQPASAEKTSTIDLTNPSEAISQIVNSDLQPLIDQLPADVRLRATGNADVLKAEIERASNAALQAQFVNMRNDLIKQLDVPATGTTQVGEVVRLLLQKSLKPQLAHYERWIPSLLALSLYFILQVFSFFYAIVINLLALLLMSVLRSAKLVEMHKETAEVETPQLSV